MSYEDSTVAELRELLKDRGRPVYGTKAELIARLEAGDEPVGPEPATEQVPVGHRRVHEHTVVAADGLYMSDDSWHSANAKAALGEADRLGLLPVVGVDQVGFSFQYLPDGRVRLTYTVPVARSS